MTVATAPDFSLSNVCVCVVCVCVCTISCWITQDIFLGVVDDITTSFFPFDVHGTLVQFWVTHHVIFNQSCATSMSWHLHIWWMLVHFDMTSWFPPVGFCGTLVHPPITHSVISRTPKCHWCRPTLPDMLMGLGMTPCFLPVHFSCTLVHPWFTHSVISKTCWLVSSMLVLPHRLVVFR